MDFHVFTKKKTWKMKGVLMFSPKNPMENEGFF